MSSKASGTLRAILTLCLSLSTTVLPVLSAPAPARNSSPWVPRSLKSLFEPRATQNKCNGANGLYITNSGSGSQTFTVFEGATSINANPYTTISLGSGKSKVVALPIGFDGHVQRGKLLPATWVELNMNPASGVSDADVSLEIGFDGAVEVQGSGATSVFGFSQDIRKGAPKDAFFNPADPDPGHPLPGTPTTSTNVLDIPGDTTSGIINQATLTYEQSVLSQSDAYLIGGTGTNQALSSENCILITFY